jgi:hypothetical protein
MTQIARNITDVDDGFLLGNRLLQPVTDSGEVHDPVRRRQRLGGMPRGYRREVMKAKRESRSRIQN